MTHLGASGMWPHAEVVNLTHKGVIATPPPPTPPTLLLLASFREMGTSGGRACPVQQGVYFMYSRNYPARLMAIKRQHSQLQVTLSETTPDSQEKRHATCNVVCNVYNLLPWAHARTLRNLLAR